MFKHIFNFLLEGEILNVLWEELLGLLFDIFPGGTLAFRVTARVVARIAGVIYLRQRSRRADPLLPK